MTTKKIRLDLDDLLSKSNKKKNVSHSANKKQDTVKIKKEDSNINLKIKTQLHKSSTKITGNNNSINSPATLEKNMATQGKNLATVRIFPWWVRFIVFILTLMFFGVIPSLLLKGIAGFNSFLSSFNISLTPNDVTALVVASPKLKTDAYGRTNVLFLGIDSRGDIDASGLKNTDSIMVLSYDPRYHRMYLISFPRDLYVKFPNTYYHNKINAVYAYGERIKKGKGIEYLETVINEITGLKIQYYAMINFDAFRKIIDRLGGIDVYVDRTFVDYMYPNGHLGYMTIKFEKGWQHLNGEKALQYARSRHAAGPEGSDFARARRQQKVIEASIAKIKKKGITDPKFFYDILKTINKNVKTSPITPLDIEAGLQILEKGKPETHSLVLDPSVGNYTLIGRGNTTLYTLVPKAGLDNWSVVKRFVQDWLTVPNLFGKNPTINIYNAKDNSYYVHLRQLKQRFPYLKYQYSGNISASAKSFTTSPNSKYSDGAKYIAKNIKFIDYLSQDELKDPIKKTVNKKDLIIIFGK